MKNLITRVFTFVLCSLLFVSCEKENLNEISESQLENKQFVLQDGVLKFETKEELKLLIETIKETGAENFYNKEIKNLTKQGYEPLRPYFLEDEVEEHEAFIEKKGIRLEKERGAEGISIEEIEFDIEDELIVDSNFEVLFNFDREIIVEDKLYRYTEEGVYSIEEDEIIDFRIFLKSQIEKTGIANKNSLPDGFEFIEMDLKSDVKYVNSTINSLQNKGYTTLDIAKKNFETKVFSPPTSLWAKTFGYSITSYISTPDSKRVKVKFWNRDWLLFSSVGCEVRFQKKKKVWRWTYYVKSYPTKVALGINSVSYIYNSPISQVIPSSLTTGLMYTWKGVNYYENGTNMNTYKKIVNLNPVSNFFDADFNIEISVFKPKVWYGVNITFSDEDLIKELNKQIDSYLVSAYKKIPSLNKASKNPQMAISEIFKNKYIFTIANREKIKTGDNNITEYFDFSTATLGASINSGSSEITPSFKPSIGAFTTKSIDVFGAAYYDELWYGVRIISADY